MKPTSALVLLAYLKPLGALGLLSRWLVHLLLHCTDKAQTAICSCTLGTKLLNLYVHITGNVYVYNIN